MFLILFILLVIGLIWIYYKKPLHYIEETIRFFSQSDTPWLTPPQLTLFKSCRSYRCYSQVLSHLDAPSLIHSMLIGQPLKYIWRDRNANELIKYLMSLKKNHIDFKDSIIEHASLYTSDYGEWPQGMKIIDSCL